MRFQGTKIQGHTLIDKVTVQPPFFHSQNVKNVCLFTDSWRTFAVPIPDLLVKQIIRHFLTSFARKLLEECPWFFVWMFVVHIWPMWGGGGEQAGNSYAESVKKKSLFLYYGQIIFFLRSLSELWTSIHTIKQLFTSTKLLACPNRAFNEFEASKSLARRFWTSLNSFDGGLEVTKICETSGRGMRSFVRFYRLCYSIRIYIIIIAQDNQA